MPRINFNVMMLKICQLVAQRAMCVKGKVGAVIVKDGQIVSCGFNGMITGLPNCECESDCTRLHIPHGTRYEVGDCGHAESNAIFFCAKNGISCADTKIYISSAPCELCARAIVQAGIKEACYIESSLYTGAEVLKRAGVKTHPYSKEQIEEYNN